MKKLIIAALAVAWCAGPAVAGPGPAWAWDASKITNNGSVQIQSTNGSSTYNAVQNPTGAVAKTNQSALTQPPTVIIQATSGAYGETIPLIDKTSNVPPSCPAGYTRVFTATGSGCPNYATYNIASTRWSLYPYGFGGGGGAVSWLLDQNTAYMMPGTGTTSSASGPSAVCATNVNYSQVPQPWAASLCTK